MDVSCVNISPKEQTINLTHLKLFIISMKKVFFIIETMWLMHIIFYGGMLTLQY